MTAADGEASEEVDYTEDLLGGDEDASEPGSESDADETEIPPALLAFLQKKERRQQKNFDKKIKNLENQNAALAAELTTFRGGDDPKYVPLADDEPFVVRGKGTKHPQKPQLLRLGFCEKTSEVFFTCGGDNKPLPAKAKEFATVASSCTYLHDIVEFVRGESVTGVLEAAGAGEAAIRVTGSLDKLLALLRNRFSYLKVTETGEVEGECRKNLDHQLYGHYLHGTHDEGGDVAEFVAAQREAISAQVAIEASKLAARRVAKADEPSAEKGEETGARAGKTRRGGAKAKAKRARSQEKK